MPIFLVRHGESHANEQNLFAGRLDSPLTLLGVRQAHQAAERVAALGLRFDEVHVSPLGRAQHTARIILDRLPHRPASVVAAEELVERDFGVFSGRNKSLVKKSIGFGRYTEYFHSHTGRPPGGESWTEMHRRAADYYRDVLLPASRSGRNVLVVAHKYVVEMLALVVAGASPQEYRDLKIPNARPLSEDDLRRAALAPAAAGLVNDLGEVVEIRLPLLAVAAALLGLVARSMTQVQVPASAFDAMMVVLLAVGSFFGMLRVDPGLLRGSLDSLRPGLTLLLVRVTAGLALVWCGGRLPLLLGLYLLLPPALIAPTLSLLWGGDYFFAVRHTVVSSLALPLLVLTALVIPDWFPWGHSIEPGALGPVLATYLTVLVSALLAPGAAAQFLRHRNPIRAGSLSTNWHWLGGLALVPLAALTTFSLTPPSSLQDLYTLPMLLAGTAAMAVLLAGWRSVTFAFLRRRRLAHGISRDIYITQNTPNVFLWLSMATVIASPDGSHPSLLGLTTALAFFLAVLTDERIFLRSHTRDLQSQCAAVAATESRTHHASSRAQPVRHH